MNYTVKTLCHDCTVASVYGLEARTNDPAHSRAWLRAYTEAGELFGVEEIRHQDKGVAPCQHCGGDTSEGAWDVVVDISIKTGGNK
jgi:hypothetical protein